MKNVLRFFGLLDAAGIILTAPQVWVLITGFNKISSPLLITLAVIRILLFISLFISAVGFILLKKYGIITYCIQFLFRFVTFIFTFGFITYLNSFFPGSEEAVRATLTLAVFGEFLRLYLSIRFLQRTNFNL